MTQRLAFVAATAAVGVGIYYLLQKRRSKIVVASKMAMKAFNKSLVDSSLTTIALGRKLTHFVTVESTMPLAEEASAAGGVGAHGTLIVADKQTKGIGRRNRGWASEPEGNLYVSFIWAKAGLQAVDCVNMMAKMNTVLAIAMAKTAQSHGVNAKVKWPNDIWVAKRKMGGILVNCDSKHGGVVGFGINVNQDMSKAEPTVAAVATSLAAEVGHEVPRETVLAGVCNEVERLMKLSLPQVMEELKPFDMLVGTVVRVHHKSREESSIDDYDAEVLGYTAKGYLSVRNTETKITKDLCGEEISISPK